MRWPRKSESRVIVTYYLGFISCWASFLELTIAKRYEITRYNTIQYCTNINSIAKWIRYHHHRTHHPWIMYPDQACLDVRERQPWWWSGVLRWMKCHPWCKILAIVHLHLWVVIVQLRRRRHHRIIVSLNTTQKRNIRERDLFPSERFWFP